MGRLSCLTGPSAHEIHTALEGGHRGRFHPRSRGRKETPRHTTSVLLVLSFRSGGLCVVAEIVGHLRTGNALTAKNYLGLP